MARRKITFGDFALGAIRSLRNGTAMNPFMTQKFVTICEHRRLHYTVNIGMKEFDLKTIEDVIRYWRNHCVNGLPGHSKVEVASWMVGAMVHADQGGDDDRFDKWCEEDEDFAAVFNRAWTLETEPANSIYIDGDWEEILEHLAKLEAKYKVA